MADTFSAEQRSWVMGRIRSRDTVPERIVRSMLHRIGFRFRLHRKDLPGKPDIVLPKHRAIVFVHGCYWHGHGCKRGRPPRSNQAYWSEKIAGNRARDDQHVYALKTLGWRPIVIWECELRDPDSVLDKLRAFLSA